MFTVSNRELQDVQIYGHDAGGLAAFTDDIQTSPAHPTWILADITEEEFHIEPLPHVYGRDQRMMLSRKINGLFHDTRFRRPFKQGREKDGRRDDIFLLAGISNQGMLDPWIDRLLEEHIPIPGIHSIPLLTRQLYQLLKPFYRHVLIISHGEMSGMRQTYFDNGQFKVSRLTPTRRLTAQSYLDLAASETYKFWHFLTGSRALPDNEILHVILLGNSELEQLTRDYQSNNPLIRFHTESLGKLVDKTGFRGIRDTEYADDFFAVLLTTSRQSNPYATHRERRFYYHLLAGRSMIAVSVLVLLYTLSLLPEYILDGIDTFDSYNKTVAQQQRFSNLYKQAYLQIPKSAVPGAVMSQAVEAHNALLKQHASPLPLLKEIGAVLTSFPNLSLKKIDWASSEDQDENTVQTNIQLPGPLLNGSDDSDGKAKGEMHAISPVLVISGHVDTGSGSVRKAIEQLDNLGLWLSNLATVTRAEVINYPLEINPEKTLSGGGGKEATGRADGMFSIRIVGQPIL